MSADPTRESGVPTARKLGRMRQPMAANNRARHTTPPGCSSMLSLQQAAAGLQGVIRHSNQLCTRGLALLQPPPGRSTTRARRPAATVFKAPRSLETHPAGSEPACAPAPAAKRGAGRKRRKAVRPAPARMPNKIQALRPLAKTPLGAGAGAVLALSLQQPRHSSALAYTAA